MRKGTFTRLALPCLVGMAAATFAVSALADNNELMPTGKGWGVDAHGNAQPNARPGSGMQYHGGPVILGTTNVYYIWYGNWAGNTAPTILNNLASSIGGSPYFNINTTYYNGSNVHVTNFVYYAGSAVDSYSQGSYLSDAGVQAGVM